VASINNMLCIGAPMQSLVKREETNLALFDRSGNNHPDLKPRPDKNHDLFDLLQFDSIDDRFQDIKSSYADTCTWLLQSTEYLHWCDPAKLAQHHGFFWIKGKPGCGKSTMTKFVYKEIRSSFKEAALISFFFNARGAALEKTTVGLYRSLLVQLLQKYPHDIPELEVPSLVQGAVDERIKTNRLILQQLLGQAVHSLERREVIVIIDALDECDEDEVREMVDFFEQLGEVANSYGRRLRVLFSSRHYPHITIKRCVEMTLENQPGHSEDINIYISNKLKVVQHGDKTQTIRKEIREKASGVFMWVVLVVLYLNKASDHGQLHSLRQKLQEIPSDLNELFRNILMRDSESLDQTRLCLQWILFATRPLTPEELYCAILAGAAPESSATPNIEEIQTTTMEKFILSSSKGLAEFTTSHNPRVQFIHESVRDFLLKGNGLGQLGEHLEFRSIGQHHDRLKELCSRYIKSCESSDPWQYPWYRLSNLFPFLDYALDGVLAHADASQAEGVSQEEFLQNFNLRIWVQLKNKLTNDHELIDATVNKYNLHRRVTSFSDPPPFAARC